MTEKDKVSWSQFERFVAFVGLPGFVMLFLLGAIPYLPSPITEIKTALSDTRSLAVIHHQKTDELVRVMKQVCRGIWQGNMDAQRSCE